MTTSYWTAALEGQWCGFGTGHQLTEGDAIWVLRKIVRCETHAPEHTFVDHDAVDKARHAQEALRLAASSPVVTSLKTGEPVFPGFTKLTESPRPVTPASPTECRTPRVPAPRPPKPFAAVADVPDPKAHAHNR